LFPLSLSFNFYWPGDVTVTLPLAWLPLYEPVTVAVPVAGPAVTETVPTNWFSGIDIVEPGLSTDALVLLSAICAPPDGALLDKVTVTVALLPLATFAGLIATDATVGAASAANTRLFGLAIWVQLGYAYVRLKEGFWDQAAAGAFQVTQSLPVSIALPCLFQFTW